MRFKRKKYPLYKYYNWFLIFPGKFNGYNYWLEWATLRYERVFDEYNGHYTTYGEIVALGKHAAKYKEGANDN